MRAGPFKLSALDSMYMMRDLFGVGIVLSPRCGFAEDEAPDFIAQ
jgi:hypothetical protein